MDFIIPLQLALIPILVGVNQVLKTLGIPKRFVPITSILLGVGISFIVPGVATTFVAVVGGAVIGLSAVGLFSGTRATVGK